MATSRQKKAKAAVAKMRAAEQASRTAGSRTEKVMAAVAKIRAFFELGQNLPATPSHKLAGATDQICPDSWRYEAATGCVAG